MSEANKKIPRTFQCRSALWSTYEQMAKDLESSIDYLINDAMKQYARQRGYGPELPSAVGASLPPQPRPVPEPAATAPRIISVETPLVGVPGGPTSRAPTPPHRTGVSTAPPPPLGARAGASIPAGAPTRVMPPPPPPGTTSGSGSFPHPVPPPPRSTTGSGSFPHPAPPPPPPRPSLSQTGGFAPPAQAGAAKPALLTLHFEGDAYPVTKDRFIIGRGKANSDLTIRDPNISRQHALVEYSGGTYYIVDMGSTNGIEYRGQRVQRKAIQNGDVFRICDHEVFCSMG